MGRREELLRTEIEGWERLERGVAGLSAEQLERPGLNDEGWAIRDLWWHLAWWDLDTARVLGQMGEGTWDGSDPSDEPGWTDRVNDAELERSRSLPAAEVRRALLEARRRLLEAFGALGELTADADGWFDETAPTHYAKHLDELESWVARLRSQMPGPAASAP